MGEMGKKIKETPFEGGRETNWAPPLKRKKLGKELVGDKKSNKENR